MTGKTLYMWRATVYTTIPITMIIIIIWFVVVVVVVLIQNHSRPSYTPRKNTKIKSFRKREICVLMGLYVCSGMVSRLLLSCVVILIILIYFLSIILTPENEIDNIKLIIWDPFFCEAKSPYIPIDAATILHFGFSKALLHIVRQQRSFTPAPPEYNVIVLFLFLLQVYIVGHIPPGSDERQVSSLPNGHTTFSEKNNLRYLRLVRKYSTIILGQFFGHLHSDSFRIIYNESGKVFLAYLLLLSSFCRFVFLSHQPPKTFPFSTSHTQSKNIIFDRIKIPIAKRYRCSDKKGHILPI